MTNRFEISKAVRARVPLIVGLSGPSGTGKTFSALRLATGIRQITGQSIAVIDTEAGRSLHYADKFDFYHLGLKPPHDPLSYRDAAKACHDAGHEIVVIDSMTHEHAGEGGIQDMVEEELDRMAGADMAKRQRCKMAAWIKPKRARNACLSYLIGCGKTLILCFRAKEKLKPVKGQEPKSLGMMPIAGYEYVYECTVFFSLALGGDGHAQWTPDRPGEKLLVKRPEPFRDLLARKQIDEEMGAGMARWAEGSQSLSAAEIWSDTCRDAVTEIEACTTESQLSIFVAEQAEVFKSLPLREREMLRDAVREQRERQKRSREKNEKQSRA